MILERSDKIDIDIDSVPMPLRDIAAEAQWFIKMRNRYRSAIKEISTKLEILDDEFQMKNNYTPIHHMESRVKSVQNIMEKLQRKGFDISKDSVRKLTDIAGIRVICNYINDVYDVSELLIKQDDIDLIRKRDYIVNPKKNGYRNLHLIMTVPIFLTESAEIGRAHV